MIYDILDESGEHAAIIYEGKPVPKMSGRHARAILENKQCTYEIDGKLGNLCGHVTHSLQSTITI